MQTLAILKTFLFLFKGYGLSQYHTGIDVTLISRTFILINVISCRYQWYRLVRCWSWNKFTWFLISLSLANYYWLNQCHVRWVCKAAAILNCWLLECRLWLFHWALWIFYDTFVTCFLLSLSFFLQLSERLTYSSLDFSHFLFQLGILFIDLFWVDILFLQSLHLRLDFLLKSPQLLIYHVSLLVYKWLSQLRLRFLL